MYSFGGQVQVNRGYIHACICIYANICVIHIYMGIALSSCMCMHPSRFTECGTTPVPMSMSIFFLIHIFLAIHVLFMYLHFYVHIDLHTYIFMYICIYVSK